jgi:hypothetical protein
MPSARNNTQKAEVFFSGAISARVLHVRALPVADVIKPY